MGLVSHPDYLEGDPTSDRPKDVTTSETATTVLQLIQANHRSIYKQIQESLGITAWAAENILHEQLHACKLCTMKITQQCPENHGLLTKEWWWFTLVNVEYVLDDQRLLTAAWYITLCLTPLFDKLKQLRPRS
ncbi:hypothetical protein ILUMI_12179 [Ignelater luminosus]|uniref:Uncharacterized protein n=1 Tax=Ignelater luminosus TaxID=2038154 RepID=A0A8K0CUT3_IGNLU|nr:hypothetical protein ILUMI_12179 [Ignelater luminosus]